MVVFMRTAPLLILAVACTSEVDKASEEPGGAGNFGTGGVVLPATGGTSSISGAPGNGGVNVAGAGGNVAGAGGNVSAGGLVTGGVNGAPDASTVGSGGSGGAGGGAGGMAGSGVGDGGAGGPQVCGTAPENGAVRLSCPAGQIVERVVFASYGNPQGSCGGFTAGSCNATTSISAVESLCVGRSTCTVSRPRAPAMAWAARRCP